MSNMNTSADTVTALATATLSTKQDHQDVVRPKRLNFSNPNLREEHIRAFRAWLPLILHDAPHIDWNRLPSAVMGQLIRGVADGPDAIAIALAIGCASGAVKGKTLLDYCDRLISLFRKLRSEYGMSDLATLQNHQFWKDFAENRTPSLQEITMLSRYDTLAAYHERAYRDKLNERQRLAWEPYLLPLLPVGIEKLGLWRLKVAAEQKRRKEQSDVLVPLFPLLVELAQLRKQRAERLIKEFRRQRDRAQAGEIELPYHFQYTDRVIDIGQDAATQAEVKLVEHEVTLSLTLWDRVTWAEKHPECYKPHSFREVTKRIGPYSPERSMYFLQYKGPASDFLWCGDLIAKGLLHKPRIKQGFGTTRSGLLTPKIQEAFFLAFARRKTGENLFEPESLYRGVLYATALAAVALSTGGRVSEILQISATRFETVVVDELKNQQPTGRKIGILVQNLLPKGARQENDRQFFLISEMAGKLLAEIGQLLEATHSGAIPVVLPYKNYKQEDLLPEPYLFQWSAHSDGRLGLLLVADVCTLLSFLFYGLSLTTRTGKPIRIVTHLLRHVLSTHARTVRKVPAEAVAYLLHHRVTLSHSTHALSISEATAYYSRLPVEQLLAMLFEAQSMMTSQRDPSYLQAPAPRTLQEMDAALREVFEQWGMIGPTALGHCSAGLCIRPDNRALCLGCPFLVPHYSNLPNAITWRKLYVLEAQLHDAHGHHIDAKQARQMLQYLDDIITLMQIQIRTRQDGGYLPFADTFLPPQDEAGEIL